MSKEKPIAGVVEQMARECIAVRVRVINRVITGLYDDALRPHGLRISQANVLAAVMNLGRARPADVCRILRIEKSTLSRDVEILKHAGWLESDPPSGGRKQTLRLTPAGIELLRTARPAWERAQEQARELIGETGAADLDRIAARLGFGRRDE